MTLLARMTKDVGAEWSHLEPVRAAPLHGASATPACYVTVANDDKPVLRVDVYAHESDSFTFQDALIWHGILIVGLGSHVHAIALADRSTVTIALESYFGHAYQTHDYLLLASGERLFRMEPDRSLRWKSGRLGIDGVVVLEAGPTVIRGEGEWDPPGGWRPFAVLASDGAPAL